MLLSSAAACSGPAATPPATCLELRPPCSLPEPPPRPALESAKGKGDLVEVSLADARRMWAYLAKTQAWMAQARACSIATDKMRPSTGTDVINPVQMRDASRAPDAGPGVLPDAAAGGER